jgi:hypothetical protein
MKKADMDNGRDEKGRFTVGNPGGPGGPRRRQSELRRAAEDAVTPDHVAAMIRRAARMALEGDLQAMRLVLERTCGRANLAPPQAEPLGITIPKLDTTADCDEAVGSLIKGICQGGVDREAAKILIDAIQARLKAIEVNELEERLAQLEENTQMSTGRRV